MDISFGKLPGTTGYRGLHIYSKAIVDIME